MLTDNVKALVPCEDPITFRVKVLGLTEVVIERAEQALELLYRGNLRRRMESTFANNVSSRSHAVIQIHVEYSERLLSCPKTNANNNEGKIKRKWTCSTLSLIDLAGSERAASTQNRGERLREGANINKSLISSCKLYQCIKF